MMQNADDEPYRRTLIEQLWGTRPWLAKELQDNKLLYLYASTLYAAEDALNLAFSYYSLGAALRDSFEGQSDARSSAEWHAFEVTPEGIAITVVCSFFLFSFSSIATYYADVDIKDYPIMARISNAWSYVRDMLKVFKWDYKGIRSTLAVILRFAGSDKALLFQMLFPIALVTGILAILNRFWIRAMRAERKKKQAENDELAKMLSEKSSAIIQKSKLPTTPEERLSYLNTFFYLNNDTEQALYFVEKDQNGVAQFTPVEIDIETFDRDFQTIQSENLCKKLKPYIKNKGDVLYVLKELPNNVKVLAEDPLFKNKTDLLMLPPKYYGSVIYLDDPTLELDEQVYLVDGKGHATLDPRLSKLLANVLEEDRKNRNVIAITPQQAHQLIPGFAHKKIGFTYQQWLNYKNREEFIPRTQSVALSIGLYIACIFGGIIDGLYFYMGVLFVSMLNPHLFVGLFSIAVSLFVACIISRVYEEFDFQRKFRVSQLKVELAKCETECKILENKLSEVRLGAAIPPGELSQEAFIERLLEQLQSYETLKEELRKKTEYSFYSALCEGLRNGLAMQGIIAGLMFLVILIMALNGSACSPVLVLSFISVSMGALFACLAQYVISYQLYKNQLRQDALQREKEAPAATDWREAYAKATTLEEKQRILLEAKNNLEFEKLKRPPQFFVVEWCEVIRLLFSGYVKGSKTFGEITYDPLADGRESWSMFLVGSIFSVVVAVIFALRTVNKMFYQKPETVLVTLEESSSSDAKNQKAKNSIFGRFSMWSQEPAATPTQQQKSFSKRLSEEDMTTLHNKLKSFSEIQEQSGANSPVP